jgi:hypothetical protein
MRLEWPDLQNKYTGIVVYGSLHEVGANQINVRLNSTVLCRMCL